MNQVPHFRLLLVFWLLLAASLFSTISAQTYTGDLTLSNQSQVDAFAYTEVTGSLYISGGNITNLQGLASLTQLGGNLHLLFNPALTNLDGLEGLTAVPGYLWIRENVALLDINALENVQTVGGLGIDDNDLLTQVDGLSALQTVNGEVVFGNNLSLQEVDGLASLTTIGEWLFFAGNPALTNLDGLSSLTSIGAALDLRDNLSLTQIDGLAGLLAIPGRLWIKNNPVLLQLGGLANVSSVGEFVLIDNNDNLTNLEGLEGLTAVPGYLWIKNNPSLVSLNGLASVSQVNELIIEDNDLLTQVDGLSALQTVTAQAIFEDNLSLQEVDGLASLTTVGGRLFFARNPALQNLDGLSSLTSIGAELGFHDNLSLTQIDGLASLTQLPSYLWIKGNPSLVNLNGLANVSEINELIIEDNAILPSLQGLEALRTVGTYLNIRNNPLLNDFCGLYGLMTDGQVAGAILFSGNQSSTSSSAIVQDCAPQLPTSDWKEIGPLISPITEMSYDGSLYLYASSSAGVYRSTDMGDNWEFTSDNGDWERVGGHAMYRGSNRGFVHVNGASYALWFDHSPFYPQPPYLEAVDGSGFSEILCEGEDGDCLDAWDPKDMIQWNNRVVVSTGSRGEIWYLDLPTGNWQVVNHFATTLWKNGNQLWSSYAGGAVSVSMDGGQTWSPYGGGNLPGEAVGFAKKGYRVFAAVAGHGVFTSFQGGSWTNVSSNLPNLSLVDIASHQNVIHVATEGQWVWKTFNNGQSWTKAAKAGVDDHPISSLSSLNGRLFAGGVDGIARRAAGSDDWDLSVKGLSNSSIDWMAARSNSLLVGKTIGEYSEGSPEFEGWLYASQSPYQNWQAADLAATWGIDGMQQQGNLVFTWTRGDDYDETYPELFTTYLNGTGPTYIMDFCYDDDEQCQYEFDIRSVAAIGNHLFILSQNGRIGISDNRGYNDDTEPSFVFSLGPASFNRLQVDGNQLIACSSNGLYTSSNLGQSWTPAGLQGISVNAMVRGNGYWLAQTNGGLHRLMDNDPAGWQSLGVFKYGPRIVWMNQVLYTIYQGDINYSLDKGSSWQVLPRDPGVPPANPYALAVEGNDYLFIGTEEQGIWRHPAVSNSAARLAKPEVSALVVYPNPTQGALQVRTQAEGRLSVWSLDGRLIQQGSLSAGEHSLDLANQPTGLYLLRWETSEGLEVRKIQKQ